MVNLNPDKVFVNVSAMARLPCVVVVGVLTQRGNARQVILASDSDRSTYLASLRQYSDLHWLSLLGYCLMSNHVLIVVPPLFSDCKPGQRIRSP